MRQKRRHTSYTGKQKNSGYKFMQVLGYETWLNLKKIASERDLTVQELLRAVVIPDWFKWNKTWSAAIEQTIYLSKKRRKL